MVFELYKRVSESLGDVKGKVMKKRETFVSSVCTPGCSSLFMPLLF